MRTPQAAAEVAFAGDDLYPKTLDCVHCGLCLSACPTYQETGRETSSPRGRVYLMRGVAEGRIPLGEVVVEEAYLCLGCRACETACPSGVRFGALVERTRAEIERAGLRRGLAKRIEAWALQNLVPRPRRLAALVSVLGIAQWLRLDRLALAFLPERLREVHAQLPRIPPRSERRKLLAGEAQVGFVRRREVGEEALQLQVRRRPHRIHQSQRFVRSASRSAHAGVDLQVDRDSASGAPGGGLQQVDHFEPRDDHLRSQVLGGVCLHKGCIPSKTLLHVVELITQAEHAAQLGLRFGKPQSAALAPIK